MLQRYPLRAFGDELHIFFFYLRVFLLFRLQEQLDFIHTGQKAVQLLCIDLSIHAVRFCQAVLPFLYENPRLHLSFSCLSLLRLIMPIL